MYFVSFKRSTQFLRAIFLQSVGLIGLALVTVATIVVLPNLTGFFEREAFERVEYAFRWGFEIFLNAQSGSAETATTNALLDSLVIPTEPGYFLFGLGVFDSGAASSPST